jgi:hypothetical protein
VEALAKSDDPKVLVKTLVKGVRIGVALNAGVLLTFDP